MSLSARRAWIEMTTYLDTSSIDESLSARRAWIEITDDVSTGGEIKSLSARRAWIEITCIAPKKYPVIRRSPQGERG